MVRHGLKTSFVLNPDQVNCRDRCTLQKWNEHRKRCMVFRFGGNGAGKVQIGVGADATQFDVVVQHPSVFIIDPHGRYTKSSTSIEINYNIWPDIMTGWMGCYRRAPSIRRVTAALPFNGVTLPPDSPGFKWPSAAEVVTAQSLHKASALRTAKPHENGLLAVKGATCLREDLRRPQATTPDYRSRRQRWT